MRSNVLDPAHFRDELSNVDPSGKRLWIYAKKPRGKFHDYRTWLSWFLMLIMFGGPFMRLNDRPLLLLNILERKFIIFGMVFWPQDLNLFALLMLSFMLFIILFTVLFGRVWCGWVCPQTIFMEMLFRKIEYAIEGDYQQQIKLDNQKLNFQKIIKKTFKHLLFWVLSFVIANTFLAYIIGYDELKLLVIDGPLSHIGLLVSLIIFTSIFYFVYARMRELICNFICPYGRLQGLLLDKNSLVVGYDFVRGEPRKKIKRSEERISGDCVDCELCVKVCPTGIDIRNGTQLECIHCTACMDACDEVMIKIAKPKGLIRFASLNGITKGTKLRLNARNVSYTVVLAALFGFFIYLLVTRKLVETTMLRAPGMLYQNQNDGRISNLYSIEFVNKTFQDLPVEIKLIEPKGEIELIDGNEITVHKESIGKTSFFIIVDVNEIHQISTPVRVQVFSNGKLMEEMKSRFNGPQFKTKR